MKVLHKHLILHGIVVEEDQGLLVEPVKSYGSLMSEGMLRAYAEYELVIGEDDVRKSVNVVGLHVDEADVQLFILNHL